MCKVFEKSAYERWGELGCLNQRGHQKKSHAVSVCLAGFPRCGKAWDFAYIT